MPDGVQCLTSSGTGYGVGRTLAFVIPWLLPTGNVLLRQHWRERGLHRVALAWEVRTALAGHMPAEPFARARVTVQRLGLRAPDRDNLVSSVKCLLDVLQPLAPRCPSGLGVIAGDDPDHLELAVEFLRVGKVKEQRTRVRVEELLAS